MPDFLEFFAGGGMARQGLGPEWTCRFANDFDLKKASSYRANFGETELKVGDVRAVTPADLPGTVDLVWASFPCQDLSLAGGGAGLGGERSGAFHPFWTLMTALVADARAPGIIALENVCGTLTSRGGDDFLAIWQALTDAGYRCGALVIDARLFVPQSRSRLFVVGVRGDIPIGPVLLSPEPIAPFHTRALRRAVESVAAATSRKPLWWRVPPPERRVSTFADAIEDAPDSVAWHTPGATRELLALMSPVHSAKLEAAKRTGRRMVGGVYRRTRLDEHGAKVQRAEVRFDDVVGCLRTPAGGSSRQVIVVVDGERVRSRLISARETARLMGLPDDYKLPDSCSEAYHLTGDGVAVDVVRHLARHLFEPLLTKPSGDQESPSPTRAG